MLVDADLFSLRRLYGRSLPVRTRGRAWCAVGNALELLRDMYVPESDQWLWHTEVLAMLDEAVDMLVYSADLEEDAP